MSQYPQQPYPPQGPPMGPPMGGPPMYAPPPKKTGIVLLILGLLALVIGGVLTIVGIGGMGKAASEAQNLENSANVFEAPGEVTLTLNPGQHFLVSMDQAEHNGKTYNPTDEFPTNDTVISVKAADGTDIPVTLPDGQGNFQSGGSSGEVVRQFNISTAGQYTVSISNPEGMDDRLMAIFSLEQLMGLIGAAGAGLFGLACGAPLALIGLILIVVWLIVRK